MIQFQVTERIDRLATLMPKVELHAHLNGSLTDHALLELGELNFGETSLEFKTLCNSFKLTDTEDLVECFKKFKIAHDLTSNRDALRRAVCCVIRDFYADNVIYLELRTTPKENESMSKVDYLKNVLETICFCRQLYPNILVKLLPSIDRSQGIESARTTLDAVKELLSGYSDILKGIDFSGDPTKGNFETFKDILNEARQLDLKLTLHCGEIDNQEEIKEMLEFGMNRCGHGTFIRDDNFKLLKEKKIPVECCISSNIKCGTVKSYESHHFITLFAANCPTMLCTDDSGVFNTTLSNEFKIAQGIFELHPADFEMLTLNAVYASFADDQEKMNLRSIIANYFLYKLP